MSAPTYRTAKLYFTILETAAFIMLVIGLIVAIDLYQNAGALIGLGAAASTTLIFLAINAFNQIGQATIHTAENTRRMADMMEADRKSRSSAGGFTSGLAADESARTEQLVARR